jgi:hypothetical protein
MDGLTVDGTGAEVISVNSTANGSQIVFDSATTSSDWSVGIANDATDDFLIYQGGAGTGDILLYTDGTERLRVLHGGNVGIGTSSPQKTLHIEHAEGVSEGVLITGASDTSGNTTGILLRVEAGESDSSVRAKGGIFFERTGDWGVGKLHLANDGGPNNDSATISDAKLTIDNSGNVGIRTDDPAVSLDITASSGGGIRLKADGQITNGFTGGLTDFRKGLTFENAASSHAFSIGYGQGGHLRVSFHDGSSTFTELVEFKNSGTLNLSAGNLEIQPGYGIDFSGNANASGMSSELLDDYEEGTFTATIGSNGTHPTITQGNTIDCRYTKIGNVCTVHGYSGVRNITAVGTGSPLISGLPFTATNYAQPVLGHCNMFPDSVSGYVEVNQSYFFPIKVGATAHDAYTTGAKYIMFSMTYRVN